MQEYIIAHDLGTSGNKATLFSANGKMLKNVVCSYPVNYFNGIYAEQDPNDWWLAVCNATKALLKDEDPKLVKAVSFSGQMMGCVCVDHEGNALRNAIIWADMRSEKEEEELTDKIPPERFYKIVGHKLSRSYSLEKLMWIKKNESDVYKNTYKMLNAKDYIVQRLTGNFYTDYSDASGTNAFDLNKSDWSDEIIAAAGIKRELFPEIKPSTYIAGQISNKISQECGLAPGTLVIIGGGDGSCASVGAGSISEGITYNCLGSSSWISTVSKKPYYDPDMRTVTWAHVIPGLMIPSGTMQTAGAAYSWAMDRLCKNEILQSRKDGQNIYKLISKWIEESQAGSNNLLFMPYLLGERCPRWNSNARASFIGLKMEHTNGDMLRSVIEGIAMNLNIILEILKNAVDIKEMIVVGGLAKGDIQQQIFADVYNMPLVGLEYLEEATSIGAAVIAGVGSGLLKNFECVKDFNKKIVCKEPIKKNAEYYMKLKPIFNEAYDSQLDIFEKLVQL